MKHVDLVKRAEKLATQAHEGQFRRGGRVPYIEHPKAVAGRVGEDIDAQVVAWLHDVIEDCNITPEQLKKEGFSDEQIHAIELMTKTEETDYEEYLENIAQSSLATKVKIADMISNLADTPTAYQLKKYAKGLQVLTKNL